MLRDGEEIQIRLNSIKGSFFYIVEREQVPNVTDNEFSYKNRDQWIGGQY